MLLQFLYLTCFSLFDIFDGLFDALHFPEMESLAESLRRVDLHDRDVPLHDVLCPFDAQLLLHLSCFFFCLFYLALCFLQLLLFEVEFHFLRCIFRTLDLRDQCDTLLFRCIHFGL